MRKYKHILFDFDNTLWDFETNSMKTLQELYHLNQLDKEFDSFEHFHDLYQFKNNLLWADYANKQISKKTLNLERFNYPLTQVGINNPEFALRMSQDYLTRATSQTCLMPHAIDLLDYLSGKYKMHILSNGFAEVQYLKLKNSKLEHYFDRIILSEQVGVLKPDKRIFNFAITSLNARKSEVLMIGDNFGADIAGAKNVGIDHIYYALEPYVSLPFEPTHVVNSLLEIKSIL